MKPYIFEEIGTIKEGEIEATLHHATLEKLRHPFTKEHLTVCLVNAQTAQDNKNMGHVESLDRILTRLKKDVEAHIIIAPEYSYYPEKPLTERQKENFLRKQKQNTNSRLFIPGTFVWQKDGSMYNAAYLLSNGDVIGHYLKMSDGGEAREAKKFGLVYQPGNKLGVFEWGTLRIGIEICADAGILAARGIRHRDLLFLISCGREDLDTRCLRYGGYGFVNDGYRESVFLAYRQVY